MKVNHSKELPFALCPLPFAFCYTLSSLLAKTIIAFAQAEGV
jgi:hypothetical protein